VSLYLYIAGDYDRLLENTFVVRLGKVPEFILGKTVGTLCIKIPSLFGEIGKKYTIKSILCSTL